MEAKLAVLIVTRDSEKTIEKALGLLLKELKNFCSSAVFVLDNASADKTKEIVSRFSEARLIASETNTGFSEGNNILINFALEEGFDTFLFLNPDAAPEPGAIMKLLSAKQNTFNCDAFTPKLIRANSDLSAIEPRTIDAAGMFFTKNFRHLDRGSNEEDKGAYDVPEIVSAGTGAALLVSENFIRSVSFLSDSGKIELFDSRFFAYREDAELALRANRFGLKFEYVPSSVFTHVRRVIPERRSELPDFINALSIRNRLLLLISHYDFSLSLRIQISTLLRNCGAFGYALLQEKESRKLLLETLRNYKKHLARRQEIKSRSILSSTEFSKHFR